MQTECLHSDYRWLDCADCDERGEECDVLVCVDCGADRGIGHE
jgi:hypothetical protein